MRFISTRGRAAPVGFVEALLAGLAEDGGLHAPAAWPSLAPETIASFAGRPYAEVAAEILGLFTAGEIETAALRAICEKAYGAFAHPAVAPLRQLAPGRFLLELFHGPTLAFKDIAMRVLAGLIAHALTERGRTATIVTATSGDTGGAAAAAFAGMAGVRLVVLYPQGRVSDVQRRFMTATGADNVRCLALGGDFDACQGVLKALFADRAFAAETGLAAVNSINFARIAAQTVYYFTAAASLGAPHREVAFTVPTGNFGDAFAGWAARRMGLPVARLTVATNANDIVARALDEGLYRPGPAIATRSPAMDIQVASNFERLHFEYAGRDNLETAAAFSAFARTGEIALPRAMREALAELFEGRSVSPAATEAAMRRAFAQTGVLVDPHTAVGLAAADLAAADAAAADSAAPLDPRIPMVVLATADPAKFPEAVAAAGLTPRAPPPGLLDRPERIDALPADAGAVKAYVRAWK
jgi:threonine synthase